MRRLLQFCGRSKGGQQHLQVRIKASRGGEVHRVLGAARRLAVVPEHCRPLHHKGTHADLGRPVGVRKWA